MFDFFSRASLEGNAQAYKSQVDQLQKRLSESSEESALPQNSIDLLSKPSRQQNQASISVNKPSHQQDYDGNKTADQHARQDTDKLPQQGLTSESLPTERSELLRSHERDNEGHLMQKTQKYTEIAEESLHFEDSESSVRRPNQKEEFQTEPAPDQPWFTDSLEDDHSVAESPQQSVSGSKPLHIETVRKLPSKRHSLLPSSSRIHATQPRLQNRMKTPLNWQNTDSRSDLHSSSRLHSSKMETTDQKGHSTSKNTSLEGAHENTVTREDPSPWAALGG